MSLRVIHICVILISIVLTLFFGVWALKNYETSGGTPVFFWGIASLAGGIALIPYLIWFIRKTGKKAP